MKRILLALRLLLLVPAVQPLRSHNTAARCNRSKRSSRSKSYGCSRFKRSKVAQADSSSKRQEWEMGTSTFREFPKRRNRIIGMITLRRIDYLEMY